MLLPRENPLYRDLWQLQKGRCFCLRKCGQRRPNIVIRPSLPYSKYFPPSASHHGSLVMSRWLLTVATVGLIAAQSVSVLAQQATPPQNDTDDAPQLTATYTDIVAADQPVARWRLDDEQGIAELN